MNNILRKIAAVFGGASQQPKLSFACNDNKGYVIDGGDYIFRIPYSGYEKYSVELFEFYKKFSLSIFGIVDTEMDKEKYFLKHKKILVTYPHEWPPALLRDAALFHLNLLLQLERYGLSLKDGLPENILFESINPVFVDFFSIIATKDMEKEEWLAGDSKAKDLRPTVLERMFFPFFLLPLLYYAQGCYDFGKLLLAEKFCNSVGYEALDSNQLKELFPEDVFSSLEKSSDVSFPAKLRMLWNSKRYFTGMSHKLQQTSLFSRFHAIRYLCSTACTVSWLERISTLIGIIESLPMEPPRSGYTNYYALKGEDAGLSDSASWNEKQVNVATLLNCFSPKTVLDIGANTGWFSQLASMNGARVVAVDNDLACVDSLYRMLKYSCRLPITPLWMPFDDLTRIAFSVNRFNSESPARLPAVKRLRSELVLCLGLLHHLTLGMGKSFLDVFSIISALAEKIAIVEFVDIDDKLIESNPTFFNALPMWSRDAYSIDKAIAVATEYGWQCSIQESTPKETRRLIVMEKLDR